MPRSLRVCALLLSITAVAGCDSGREVSSETARNGGVAGASRAPADSGFDPGPSERPAPGLSHTPLGSPAGSAETRIARTEAARETTGADLRGDAGGITVAESARPADRLHGGMELEEARAPADPEIPSAPMGARRGRTALAGAPGYFPPDDPEAGSVERGRREVPRRDVAFSEGQPSGEDLARAILAALRTREPRELHRLRVTKEEFSVVLWPEMPQSRPITNTRAQDAWFFVEADNHAGVNAGMSDWGGQNLEFVRLRYETGRAPYTNYTLYRGVRIVARTPEGREVTLGFVEAFAECGGLWKVYSFKD